MLSSCGNDDVNTTNDPQQELLSITQNNSIAVLTNNGERKTWIIESAILSNASGEFEITQNFNVQDDAFIFSSEDANISLEWQQGHRINVTATTAQETLVDHYLSPQTRTLAFSENSGTILENEDNQFSFELIDDDTINANLSFGTSVNVLNLVLSPQTEADIATVPTFLNFETVFSYHSNSIQGFAPGMIGSYTDNSLFIVTREDEFAQNNDQFGPERIFKYNLDNNESSEKLFFNQDFVSKELHIVDNELVVVGSQFINSYDTSLANDPNSTNNGIEHFCPNFGDYRNGVTRHGMAVLDNDVYIIGGSLANDNSPATNLVLCGETFADIIYRWNIQNQSLEEFARLPDTSFWGRGTIVNNNLYVFGGRQFFFGEADIYDTIHILNLNTADIETLNLPSPMEQTWVDKLDNLIYVAGNTPLRDDEGMFIMNEFTLGVFDTLTNTFNTIDTNLTQDSPFDTIHQICVFNNQLYLLYGSLNQDNDPDELDEYDIMRVNLN